jgi:cytochrome c553
MIKHIVAAVITLLALAAMYRVYQLDTEVNKVEEIGRMIAKTQIKVKLDTSVQSVQQSQTAIETMSNEEIAKAQEKKKKELDEKLQALKNKAGNVAAFKVSPLYKQKCSSCHGVNGEGIIGPKLIGLSAEKVYQNLTDFKSGKRKNYVMYGLLSKMDEEQLKSLADEIGSFEAKMKAQQ